MATRNRKRRSCKHGKLKRPVRTKKGRKRRCRKSNGKTKRKSSRKLKYNVRSKPQEKRKKSPRARVIANLPRLYEGEIKKRKEKKEKKKNKRLREKRKNPIESRVLSVRPNKPGIYPPNRAPPSVGDWYVDNEGKTVYNVFDMTYGIPRSKSIEFRDPYENIHINDSDVSYVIYCHGLISPTGESIDIPPNVKIYSPAKCLGQTLITSPEVEYAPAPTQGSENLDAISLSCPSSVFFEKSFILTDFDNIPEIILNHHNDDPDKQFVAGVYRCTESNFFDATPVISIDKEVLLSTIIDKLNQGENINIILFSCLSFGDYEDQEYAMETIQNMEIKSLEKRTDKKIEDIRAGLTSGSIESEVHKYHDELASLQVKHDKQAKNRVLDKNTDIHLRIGDKVRIISLVKSNSTAYVSGTIRDYDFVRKMYAVELYDTLQILYEPQKNLEKIEEF